MNKVVGSDRNKLWEQKENGWSIDKWNPSQVPISGEEGSKFKVNIKYIII